MTDEPKLLSARAVIQGEELSREMPRARPSVIADRIARTIVNMGERAELEDGGEPDWGTLRIFGSYELQRDEHEILATVVLRERNPLSLQPGDEMSPGERVLNKAIDTGHGRAAVIQTRDDAGTTRTYEYTHDGKLLAVSAEVSRERDYSATWGGGQVYVADEAQVFRSVTNNVATFPIPDEDEPKPRGLAAQQSPYGPARAGRSR